MSLSAKHKLYILITIVAIIAVGFCIGSFFYAPFEGFKGFLFVLLRRAVLIAAVAIIITLSIKYKSVSKTNKIGKYIFIGVILYGILVGLISKNAYGAISDYKDDRTELTVASADYDTYYRSFSKLGKIHYLNVNIDGKLHIFLIDEDTYKTAKSKDSIQILYYNYTNVIESVK